LLFDWRSHTTGGKQALLRDRDRERQAAIIKNIEGSTSSTGEKRKAETTDLVPSGDSKRRKQERTPNSVSRLTQVEEVASSATKSTSLKIMTSFAGRAWVKSLIVVARNVIAMYGRGRTRA
jgi:hypothetical protein